MLKSSRESWAAFWASPYAVVVNIDRDLRALERLWTLYDARERAWRSYCKKPLLIGSQGQEVMNPMWRDARALEVAIQNLEDRFGMTPKAAAALGITVGALQKTLDDLEREANDDSRRAEPIEADEQSA